MRSNINNEPTCVNLSRLNRLLHLSLFLFFFVVTGQSDGPFAGIFGGLVRTVGGLGHLCLLFGPRGPRINSDQVASDTPDSTIGEFYMTVKLLFWKADRDRNRELS